MVERLRDELPVVGELAVDAAGRERHAVDAEDDLVLADGDVDGVGGCGGRDARELGEGAGRDDGLGVAARTGQRGLLDREPVGVRGGHRHGAVAELHQDAGQHRTGLVLRRRPGDVVDRRDERGAIDGERGPRRLGEMREVLGALRVERVLARAAGELHRSAAGRLLERHGLLRQRADDLEKQPSCEHRRARLGDVCLKARPDRELHVGRRELDRSAGLGADEDAGEDLDGRALRHPAGHDLETIEQVFLRTDDLHAGKLLGATVITEFS